MTRTKLVVATLFAIVVGLFPLNAQTAIDRIVAAVDKEIITESDLQERVNFVVFQNRLQSPTPELRKQVLNAMIEEKLILAQALIDSIQITDEEVTRALDQQIENLTRQIGSKEHLEQYYGKPIGRIKREFRDDMRKQLLILRVRQAREANIQVSRREVEEFFTAYKDSLPKVPEEFDLSHIFITPKPDSSVELQTKAKLAAILDSLKAGGDFGEFAKRYSNDFTASNGGDLGWSKRGDFVPEFEEPLFSLKEKEISNIVKTQFGLHLIQLLERRGESVHARHILLKIPKSPASDSVAVQRLRQLRERALKGESFAELARQYSEDQETKALGGDLGRLSTDQLVPEFAEVVKNLKENEICQPHRITLGSSYGYQIVWLRKQMPEHAATLQDDYKLLEQLTLRMKHTRQYIQWLDELKKNIFWEIKMW